MQTACFLKQCLVLLHILNRCTGNITLQPWVLPDPVTFLMHMLHFKRHMLLADFNLLMRALIRIYQV